MKRLHAIRSEQGSALITAMLVMTLLLILGFSTLSIVDNEQKVARVDRVQESSFNLAEGVLSAQVYQLSTRWPGNASAPYSDCVNGGGADCPSTASISKANENVDTKAATTWTTRVRDNGGASANFYTDATAATQPGWDANQDGFMWVRAQALVRGKRRTLVALVRAEEVTLNFPRATLVAGALNVTNNGNKTIVDNNGPAGAEFNPPGDIVLRCANVNSGACANWREPVQISPNTIRSNPAQPPALTPEALDALRVRAKAEGNYFPSCAGASPAGDVPGEVVFIENAGSSCSFNGSDDYNTKAKPGVFVIGQGLLDLRGNAEFFGVIYHANLANSNGKLVELGGNCAVHGSIVIDGNGSIDLGSSKENLTFDPNVFNNLKSYGTAGIVQNSFREIDAQN